MMWVIALLALSALFLNPFVPGFVVRRGCLLVGCAYPAHAALRAVATVRAALRVRRAAERQRGARRRRAARRGKGAR